MPQFSRGPSPHNERRARGALTHMENVPLDARAKALPDRARTPRLLGCGPGRYGGAFRPRAPSLVPWEILYVVPGRLVSWAHRRSSRLFSLHLFGSPLSLLFLSSPPY